MIWDPVKPFACQCMAGYEGQLCEKGNTRCNMPFILLLARRLSLQCSLKTTSSRNSYRANFDLCALQWALCILLRSKIASCIVFLTTIAIILSS